MFPIKMLTINGWHLPERCAANEKTTMVTFLVDPATDSSHHIQNRDA